MKLPILFGTRTVKGVPEDVYYLYTETFRTSWTIPFGVSAFPGFIGDWESRLEIDLTFARDDYLCVVRV